MTSESYNVHLNGCDDSTRVEMLLTPAEVATLLYVAATVNAAADEHCQPNLRVWKVGTPEPDWDREDGAA